MGIVATFHFVSGLKRSTIIKAKDVDEASLIISNKFYQRVGHAVFELMKKEERDNFEKISDKVELFEVFCDHVMFIDYEVQ
ncbi:hypothetical protein ACQVPJ_28285 [Bacillus mycoides]|uniref:Uncharacterized protein n=1 Tax=Bacillus mycoides TaxID=1405 RepID=A0A1W6AIS1_BACMY|nr:hypothetical protein [Bacillus mycoides]ARJ25734.1 hypothetical protein B7492_32355 [Bacillus mycoides]QWI47317.1 hypothetical protein EXW55_31360 [Bacillus mycoides]TKI84148.1 hypothetical protein FC701_15055 [Bacillus mycoides]HDR7594834.1 hypothetical protein [Bacillus mycoides]